MLVTDKGFKLGLDKLFQKNGGGPCQSIGSETGVIHGIGIGIALTGLNPTIKRYIQNLGKDNSVGIVRQKISRC